MKVRGYHFIIIGRFLPQVPFPDIISYCYGRITFPQTSRKRAPQIGNFRLQHSYISVPVARKRQFYSEFYLRVRRTHVRYCISERVENRCPADDRRILNYMRMRPDDRVCPVFDQPTRQVLLTAAVPEFVFHAPVRQCDDEVRAPVFRFCQCCRNVLPVDDVHLRPSSLPS